MVFVSQLKLPALSKHESFATEVVGQSITQEGFAFCMFRKIEFMYFWFNSDIFVKYWYTLPMKLPSKVIYLWNRIIPNILVVSLLIYTDWVLHDLLFDWHDRGLTPCITQFLLWCVSFLIQYHLLSISGKQGLIAYISCTLPGWD